MGKKKGLSAGGAGGGDFGLLSRLGSWALPGALLPVLEGVAEAVVGAAARAGVRGDRLAGVGRLMGTSPGAAGHGVVAGATAAGAGQGVAAAVGRALAWPAAKADALLAVLAVHVAGWRRQAAEAYRRAVESATQVPVAAARALVEALLAVLPALAELLALPPVRVAAHWAVKAKCNDVLRRARVLPFQIEEELDALPRGYHIAPEARRTLEQVIRGALVRRMAVTRKQRGQRLRKRRGRAGATPSPREWGGGDLGGDDLGGGGGGGDLGGRGGGDDAWDAVPARGLPSLGRVLLTAPPGTSSSYQESVARAFAKKFGMALLVLDAKTVDDLVGTLRGLRPSGGPGGGDGEDGGEDEGAWGSSSGRRRRGPLGWLLSFFLTGGPDLFAMEAVRRACGSKTGQTMLLVRQSETTLAGESGGSSRLSLARLDAFAEAFSDASRGPVVVLAGSTISETGPGAMQGAAASPHAWNFEDMGMGGGGGGMGGGGGGMGGGGMDDLGGGGGMGGGGGCGGMGDGSGVDRRAMAKMLDARQAAFREQMCTIFPTRVTLNAPTDNLRLSEWRSRVKEDEILDTVRDNWKTVTRLMNEFNIQCPLPVELADQALLLTGGMRGGPVPWNYPHRTRLYGERRYSVQEWKTILSWAFSNQESRALLGSAGLAGVPGSPERGGAAGRPGTPGRGGGAGLEPSDSAQLLRSTSIPRLDLLQHDGGMKLSDSANSLASVATVSTERSSYSDLASLDDRDDLHPYGSPDSERGGGGPTPGPPPHRVLLTDADLRFGASMLIKTARPRAAITAEGPYERQFLNDVIAPGDAGVSFSDIGALGPVKDAMREAVQLPLQYPKLFSRSTLTTPAKGVLLFGPPGTGKSMLAKACATESGATFINLTLATLASKWLGDGVRYVKAAFSLARKAAPCILFVDEVDSLLGSRDKPGEHEALREIKNEFMSLWDGVRSGGGSEGQVIVVAATNRPFDLDDAALRRFSRRLLVDLPDEQQRAIILQLFLEKESVEKGTVDWEGLDVLELARDLEGFSGSDLRNLCTAAAMQPVREVLSEMGAVGKGATQAAVGTPKPSGTPPGSSMLALEVMDGSNMRKIGVEDFRSAIRIVGPSVSNDTATMSELRRWNETFGDGGSKASAPLTYFM